MSIRFSILRGRTLTAKSREWLHRYGLAELVSFSISMVLTVRSFSAFGSIVGSAFFGSFVQTIAFYGVMLYRDVQHRRQRDGSAFGFRSMLKVARNMLLEFGLAEYLDTFIIRPFFLSVFPPSSRITLSPFSSAPSPRTSATTSPSSARTNCGRSTSAISRIRGFSQAQDRNLCYSATRGNAVPMLARYALAMVAASAAWCRILGILLPLPLMHMQNCTLHNHRGL